MSTISSSASALSFHTAPELSPTSPTSTISSDAAPDLSQTSQLTVPTLLGKSNFKKWHASINPILLSNDQVRSLISGAWFEPPLPRSPDSLSTSSTSPTSPSQPTLQTILHAPILSRGSLTTHQTAHRAYELANLTTTRFIRGTLAMNVTPFVRQHTSAKGLYEQLIYLYGARAGIDMVGGPAMHTNMSMALQSRRMTKPSVSRISEEADTSPMLPVMNSEAAPAQNSRLTDESVLGYGINIDVKTRHTPDTPTTNPRNDPSVPKKKKKATFKFPNNFPFRRSTKDKHDGTTGPSHKTSLRKPSPSPATWIPSPLAPAGPYCTSSTSTSARHPSTSSPTSTISTTLSSTTPNPELAFDFSYPPRQKTNTPSEPESESGTQPEMQTLAATADFETPTPTPTEEHERESYFV